MVGKLENCFLVNAPAGSGKTTKIKAMIKEHTIAYPKDNILCITYTNRAVDELLIDISSNNVFISTIHSFLHEFISPYFAYKELLELYFNLYSADINERINSIEPDRIERNNRYKEKYGELSYEFIKKNITKLYYNELEFNSLFYGGLSHDTLISFSKLIMDKYPIIKKRIASKYQLIFIDEYQDTSADVLKLFYDCILDTKTKLYLFGDRMQQIYKNYDGSFEKELELFDKKEALTVNRRSSPTIINLLNYIYNDKYYKQKPQEDTKNVRENTIPSVIICDDVNKKLNELKNSKDNFLVLYLLNSKRFSAIGAANLYSTFNNMEKYSFAKKNNVVDALASSYEDNPDILMKLLFLVLNIYDSYNKKQYGFLVQEVKKYPKIFNKNNWNIKTHADKSELNKKLKNIFSHIEDAVSVEKLLTVLYDESLIHDDYFNAIKGDEYQAAFNVSINEVVALYNYLKDPKISTQHGVKGESHNNVIFVADDSSNLSVKMYDFLKLWSTVDLSLNKLQVLYYSYIEEIVKLENQLGFKVSKLNSERFNSYKKLLIEIAELHLDKFEESDIFRKIYTKGYSDFLKNPNITNAKACFKISPLGGIFNAYKLFYVGCSRARNKLIVLLEKNRMDIATFEKQKEKIKKIGFEVFE